MDPVRGKTEHAVVLDQHTDWGADASRDPVRFLQRAIEEIGLERRDFSRTIQALTDEKDEARARAREACQIAVAAVGAGGPCNVDEAVRRLTDRLAEVERDEARLRDERDHFRNSYHTSLARVAEVERERDHAVSSAATGHSLAQGGLLEFRRMRDERDEARRVAKTVALWDLTDDVTEAKYKAASDTALAYDVEV